MIVLGLDPSPLRLGWAAINLETGLLLDSGVYDLAPTRRDNRPHEGFRFGLRYIHEAIGEPGLVGIEKPMSRRNGEAFDNGRVFALAVEHADTQWPFCEIHPWVPAAWKKTIGLPGNCGKPLVAEWAVSQLPDPGWAITQDEADALAIAHATRQLWANQKETK